MVESEELCDEEELTRLRAYLDQQMGGLQQCRDQARQPAPAPADGAAGAKLGIRPGGGAARRREAGARRRQSDAFAELQDRARHGISRHGRELADRQFGIDARPADRHRRDLRGHSRADPGARAAWRAKCSASPPAPGRAGRAASSGCADGRPAQSGPPQRPSAHRLQAGGRALPPCAAEPRADDARGAAQGEYRRRGPAVGAQPPDRPAPRSGGS